LYLRRPGPNADIAIKIARGAVGFSIFSSYPVLQFVGRQAIVLVLSWDTDPETGEPLELSRARHVTLTLGFVGSGILMAVVVRLVYKCGLWLNGSVVVQATMASIDLGFVVSLTGATVAVTAQYLFPGYTLVC
jgi:hypothetical protein